MNRKMIWGVALLIVLLVSAGVYVILHEIADNRELTKLLEEAENLENQIKQGADTHSETEQATYQASPKSETQTAEKTITDTPPMTKETVATDGQTGAAVEKTEIAARVSPYGFGPYPEIPEGFIENVLEPSWIFIERFGKSHPNILNEDLYGSNRNHELIGRVLIKVWQDNPESRRYMEGAFFRNGKVYVNYSNRAYVRYQTIELPDGTTSRVITSWTGGSLKAPPHDPANPFQSHDDQVPNDIELIDLDKEDPGIDPYSYLGLQ